MAINDGNRPTQHIKINSIRKKANLLFEASLKTERDHDLINEDLTHLLRGIFAYNNLENVWKDEIIRETQHSDASDLFQRGQTVITLNTNKIVLSRMDFIITNITNTTKHSSNVYLAVLINIMWGN